MTRSAGGQAGLSGARLRAAMGSSKSCADRARRIPLSRQPPIWLMVSVVVAALVPLTMQLGDDPIGPAQARASAPVVTAKTLPPPSGSTFEVPVDATVEPAVDQPLVEGEPSLDDEALFEEEEVEVHDEAEAPESASPAARKASSDKAAPPADSRAGLLTRATEACKDGDKKTARSTYRTLPLGDSRRKEIRQACRREGVWIL